MNSDYKVTFLLPTCEPDEMFRLLLPSLKYLQPAKEYINFAIIFQPPYSEESIQKVLSVFNELSLEYKWIFKKYEFKKGEVPLNKIRQDCSMLYPNSLVYGLLDDDMQFESEICAGDLLKILSLFIEKVDLGIVSCRWHKWESYNFICFGTDNGLFLRGGCCYGFEGLLPENLYQFTNIKDLNINYNNENLLSLFGGYQDKLCGIARVLNKNKVIIIENFFSQHWNVRKEKGKYMHGWAEVDGLEGSNAGFISKYLGSEFLESAPKIVKVDSFYCKLINLRDYKFVFDSYPIYNRFKDYDYLNKYNLTYNEIKKYKKQSRGEFLNKIDMKDIDRYINDQKIYITKLIESKV